MRIWGIFYRLRKLTKKSTNFISSIFNIISIFIKDLFINNLPSEEIKDLPFISVFSVGSILYILILLLFLLLLLYGYYDERSSKFLAVTKSAGECNTVSKPVSGTFLADINGEWEGSYNFQYTKAIYKFEFPNFNANQEEYADLMKIAFSGIKEIGQSGYYQNLGINILMWTVFSTKVLRGGSTNILSMSGDPKMVYDRRQHFASFANINGVCDVHPVITYSTESGQLTLTFSYSGLQASSLCRSILNPLHFGYNQYYSQNMFKLVIDSRSTLTGLALNYGLLSISQLELISGTTSVYDVNGTNVNVGEYYYPRYPGMRPLLCLVPEGFENSTICVLQFFETLLYPVFNHAGISTSDAKYCICPVEKGESIGQRANIACQLYNFLSGFIFYDYNESKNQTLRYALANLIKFTTRGGKKNNFESFASTYDATILPIYRKTGTARSLIYSFCKNPNGVTCSILSIGMTDGFQIRSDGSIYYPGNDFSISDTYYQLNWGACNDTFTIPLESQIKLINNPPMPLIEKYYECKSSKLTAIFNSWGVTMGNMPTLISVLVIIVLGIYITFQSQYNQVEIPKTYSSSEKQQILDYFAFIMLLLRDKREKYIFKSKRNNNNNNNNNNGNNDNYGTTIDITKKSSKEIKYNQENIKLLYQLRDELQQFGPKIPRFYYDDSDDDDNDNDNNNDNNHDIENNNDIFYSLSSPTKNQKGINEDVELSSIPKSVSRNLLLTNRKSTEMKSKNGQFEEKDINNNNKDNNNNNLSGSNSNVVSENTKEKSRKRKKIIELNESLSPFDMFDNPFYVSTEPDPNDPISIL